MCRMILYMVPALAAVTLLFPHRASASITAVWANDGGDKVTRDEVRASTDPGSVLNSVWDGTGVSLFGARNEVVSFNLILEAASATADGVSVSFDTLTGPGGSAITSVPASGNGVFDWTGRNIELFYVRYLQIEGLSRLSYGTYDERHIPARLRRPWTGDGVGSGTWTDRPDHDRYYPDIAVPLELHPSFSVSAGRSRSIWVDIYIPGDAVPGLYQGTLTVSESGGAQNQVPVQLRVRNFTLPDLPNAKTMLFLGYGDINERYTGTRWPNAGTPEASLSLLVRNRHFQLAHRHRISLIDGNGSAVPWDQDAPVPEWLPRLNGTLFTGADGYAGPGVGVGNNVFSIGTYGSWGWQDEGEAGMRTHSDAWVNWFESQSLATPTEYFLYLIDESSNYAQIEQWAQWLNNNPGPGSGLMSMATIYLVDSAANTPALDIPTSGITVGVTEDCENAADAYLAAADKRLFLYNSSRPGSGSFATEDDGVALRELAWGHYKKRINRWFFWESTYYNNFQGGTGQTNVFQSAHTFGGHSGFDTVLGETGWNYSNGDGVLFYPGTDLLFPSESYGVEGPFASIRMKLWRRGLQDVDYLTIAAAIDPVRVGQIVESMVPTVLWEYGVDDPQDPTYVRTDISWSIDPDDWESARAELADIIELKGQDSDGDGLSDYEEHNYDGDPASNPYDPDTNPSGTDTDADDPDSDSDGLSDYLEVVNGGDPLDNSSIPGRFFINFQPSDAEIPADFCADTGTAQSPRGYGWQ